MLYIILCYDTTKRYFGALSFPSSSSPYQITITIHHFLSINFLFILRENIRIAFFLSYIAISVLIFPDPHEVISHNDIAFSKLIRKFSLVFSLFFWSVKLSNHFYVDFMQKLASANIRRFAGIFSNSFTQNQQNKIWSPTAES